jgi:hypothetical protein
MVFLILILEKCRNSIIKNDSQLKYHFTNHFFDSKTTGFIYYLIFFIILINNDSRWKPYLFSPIFIQEKAITNNNTTAKFVLIKVNSIGPKKQEKY